MIKRSSTSNSLYIKNDLLTKTLAGNPVPLLTVTSACSAEEMLQKEIILFSARVHPGESNASWVMHGVCCSWNLERKIDSFRIKNLLQIQYLLSGIIAQFLL